MNPRTRWQGWTIVEKDGTFALSLSYDRAPFIWALKVDAEDCKQAGQRVARCELRVIR